MSSDRDEGVRAGIDLGGTGVRIVILSEGRELASLTVPTASFGPLSKSERVAHLVGSLRDLIPSGKRLLSLGIGASGPVNVRTGVIENDDTLPAFSYFPLVDELSNALNLKASIDNDAVTAALGEYYLGAGVGSERLLMVTLGTGIGVALLMAGRPLRAADGSHPEAGHIPVSGDSIQCYCGLRGCWECLASRTCLQRELQTLLPNVAYEHRDLPFFRKQCKQDPRVQGVFDRYGRYVGRGLNTLLTLYGPDVTILSGSAASLYPLYQAGVEESLKRSAGFTINSKIVQSLLGDTAGAAGAALLPTLPR
ncbi:ROK family protein (plasmid) [Paraburkholderia sp. D15]|uniref:ROK family protein n=1 Tax=Paraburkholderia sp. D15 TaxID=2880218 RepID=UPI002479B740|nr:ROK family protein [Paraburkholderia sp. D15]WGS55260.1 ROK family protein [Paraburkholderia sp. D15]